MASKDTAGEGSGTSYKLQQSSDHLREHCLALLGNDEVDVRVGMEAVYAYSTSFLADLPHLEATCPEPDCLTCLMKAQEETHIAQLAIWSFLCDLAVAAQALGTSHFPEQRALAGYCHLWLISCEAMPDAQRYLILPRPF